MRKINIDKNILETLYVEQRLSIRKIAELQGCGKSVVLKRLHQYGIKPRSMQDYSLEERKEKYGNQGSSHGLWKGGKTKLNNVLRNRLSWVSRERLRLDNFTCTTCGTRSNVVAHHIKPFSELVDQIMREHPALTLQKESDRLQIISICENDSRLRDVDNLITMCEKCHKNHHSESPVKIVKYDILEKQRREFIIKNHFIMSVSEMGKELNIRHYKIIYFMKAENMPFAFENPEWLRERLICVGCSQLAKEFNSMQFRCYAKDIRHYAHKFGLVDYVAHQNDTKNA